MLTVFVCFVWSVWMMLVVQVCPPVIAAIVAQMIPHLRPKIGFE